MSFSQKLKLYRLKSAIKYGIDAVGYSRKGQELSGRRNRVALWYDIFLSWALYGFNFNDWCTFEFWEKSKAERNCYISFRRNDSLIPLISTQEIYQLFRDKSKFLNRFHKWQNREILLLTQSESINDKKTLINQFLTKYNTAILKPLFDYGGVGVMKIGGGY